MADGHAGSDSSLAPTACSRGRANSPPSATACSFARDGGLISRPGRLAPARANSRGTPAGFAVGRTRLLTLITSE